VNPDFNDQEYFNRYVQSFDLIQKGVPDTLGFVKNKDFIFSTISHKFTNLNVFDDSVVLPGTSGHGLKLAKNHPLIVNNIHQYDCQIRDEKQMKTFLYVTVLDNLFVVRKYPIINPHSGNFVGIHASFSNFMFSHPLKSLYMMHGINKSDFEIGDDIMNYKLTERQQMVLYLYLHRYSYTSIASIMTTLGHQISAARVNDHLSNLKNIFYAKTKQELMEKAVSLNYHLHLPRKFLKLGVYELNDELFITKP